MVFAGAQLGAELAQVVVEHHADRIRAVAVHVDQRVEAAFGAGEQPVDGALFVALHMVVVEVLQEVFADVLAQRLFDEREVFFVMFFTKSHFQEFAKAFGDVIGEPVAVEHGDNVVVIGREAWFWNLFQVVSRVSPWLARISPGLSSA